MCNSMINHPEHDTLSSWIFYKVLPVVFTSSRYHRDMKILKILAFNSKRFRFMEFFKNDKLMMIEWGGKILQFLSNLSLKWSPVLKIALGMFFDSRNSKMTSKLPYKLLGLSYRQILSNFTMQYIFVKKRDVAL